MLFYNNSKEAIEEDESAGEIISKQIVMDGIRLKPQAIFG